MQYIFRGKTILSKIKHIIMNLWDYYVWEAKKYERAVNYANKIANVTGKMISAVLEYSYTLTDNFAHIYTK